MVNGVLLCRSNHVLSRIRVLVILIVCTIAMPKVDTCFWTTYFNLFHAKAPQNSNGFCYFHEGCPKWNLLGKVWLNIPQDGVLVAVFVSHSFSCLIDLKMNTTTTTATPMVSFDLVFHKLSKKFPFLTFIKGNKVFYLWMVIPRGSGNSLHPFRSSSPPGTLSFSNRAPLLWNNLPQSIQQAPSIPSFKSNF